MFTTANLKVGVIIPAYNCDAYITDTVQSILDQSRKPDMIVIVDDGSDLKTRNLIKKIVTKNPILQVEHIDNHGPAHARNVGLQMMGDMDWVAFCDADDMWHKEKLENQLNVVKDAFLSAKYIKPVGVVYTANNRITDTGEVEPNSISMPQIEGDVFNDLLEGAPVSGSLSSVLIKREALEKIGGFDSDLKADEDTDLYLRLARHYVFYKVDEVLVHLRTHPDQLSKDDIRLLVGKYDLIQKWKNQDKIYKKLRSWLRHSFIISARHSQEDTFKAARRILSELEPHIKKEIYPGAYSFFLWLIPYAIIRLKKKILRHIK